VTEIIDDGSDQPNIQKTEEIIRTVYINDGSDKPETKEIIRTVVTNDSDSGNFENSNDIVDDIANKSNVDASDMSFNIDPISPISFGQNSLLDLVEQDEQIYEGRSLNFSQSDNSESKDSNILNDKVKSELQLNDIYMKEE